MKRYFDSSALVAIYVTETFSRKARREARAAIQIPYTELHDLEVRNAMRLLHGRTLLNAKETRDLLGQLDADIEAQRLVDTRLDLFEVFRSAGGEWGHPGCSLCVAMNDEFAGAGQYVASTSNRNFQGRQGPGARTLLVSPLTAAASALQGRIADPRRYLA